MRSWNHKITLTPSRTRGDWVWSLNSSAESAVTFAADTLCIFQDFTTPSRIDSARLFLARSHNKGHYLRLCQGLHRRPEHQMPKLCLKLHVAAASIRQRPERLVRRYRRH